MKKILVIFFVLTWFLIKGEITEARDYEYDVSGSGGEDGSFVSGTIDVDQDGGDGYVYDEYGNEYYIDVDWTGKGELDGYDEDGNYYELEVD